MRLGIRTRLTIAFAASMALVLAALGTFLYLRLGSELLQSIDMGLDSRAAVIQAGIGNQGIGFSDAPSSLIDPDEAFAQILDPTLPSPIVESSSGVAGGPLVPPNTLPAVRQPAFVDGRAKGLDDLARLLIVPVRDGPRLLYVVVGATLSDRHEALDRLLALFAIGGPVALAVTSLAGWVLAGAALRPVERMRIEAAAISASEPERRLPVPETGDELERLATTLNNMLVRLEQASGRERRFVDDASHELRTPLTVLKAELEIALSRPRTSEELEAVLHRASDETDRLGRLAEDLLVLSRAEGGNIPVHRVQVGLRDVVGSACDSYKRRARLANIRLMVEATPETVHLDPIRLRQAIENLVDNALRHAGPGGTVRVSATTADGWVRIRVEDTGGGFPTDLMERAFEPFVRGSNEDGDGPGAGLGLSIVRAVAEAHGGSARALNLEGGGAVVALSLRA